MKKPKMKQEKIEKRSKHLIFIENFVFDYCKDPKDIEEFYEHFSAYLKELERRYDNGKKSKS